MPARTFLPERDADLAAWAQNLSDRVAENPGLYGVDVLDSDLLAARAAAYREAFAAAAGGPTRGPVAVAGKASARAALLLAARGVVKLVRADPLVSDEQLVVLGLTVPKRHRTPAAPPQSRPLLRVVRLESRALNLRMTDERTPERRAKPGGVDAAEIYSFVTGPGESPPADVSAWQHRGLARKAEVRVTFGGGDVGKTAHVRAAWVSTRGAPGPFGDAASGTVAA